jgi:putative Mn2+ efflux pump MntP
MSMLDRINSEIGWLKVVFGLAVALDASVIGWLFQNYRTADLFDIVAGSVAAIVFSVIVIVVNRRAYQLIDQQENL